MWKKVIIFLLFFVFALVNYTKAGEFLVQHKLHVIDSYKHSPAEFYILLNRIRQYQPGYTNNDIGTLVAIAYEELTKHGENVSVYEVAEDIKRFVKDRVGMDLKSLVRAYIDSQLEK